jgi:hypothetical protein
MRLNFSFSLNIKYLKVVLCCSRYLSCEVQQRFIAIAKYRMFDIELQVERKQCFTKESLNRWLPSYIPYQSKKQLTMYFFVNVLSSRLNLDGCSWQCFWLVLRALSIDGVILSTIDISLMPVSNCVTFKVEYNS